MSAKDHPRLVGIGGIFIDDIVQPSGQTYMAQLGGGVVHAMMGVAIWDERPGICAPIGVGLPSSARQLLDASLDTRGLYALDIPQIRAWQLFEEDGSRREIYRVQDIAPFINGPQPTNLPSVYAHSEAYYLLQDCAGILRWRDSLHGLVFWEPHQQFMLPENRDLFRETLRASRVDVVSPNQLEASAIYGDVSPRHLLDCLLEDGAKNAVVRMGAEGSVVGNQDGEYGHIPSLAVNVVDQTGAGNTYCGAFLWAMLAGYSLLEAGVAGATVASFCLEGIGVLNPTRVTRAERDQRFQTILQGVQSSARDRGVPN